MPEDEGTLVAGVETIERISEIGETVRVVDAVEVVEHDAVLDPIGGPRRTLAAATTLSTVVVGDEVAGDAEQPWGDPARMPTEPVDAGERSFEGRCGDVLGELGIPAATQDEAMDRIDMTAVELCERLDIGTRLLDEPALVEQIGVVGRRRHRPQGCRMPRHRRWQRPVRR